jgi:hypothetical protein
MWNEDFGFAAGRYPIIATEIGFSSSNRSKEERVAYGAEITSYLDSKGIGWVARCFDPGWHPSMISSWEPFELTEEGKFFSDAMHKEPAPLATAAGKQACA